MTNRIALTLVLGLAVAGSTAAMAQGYPGSRWDDGNSHRLRGDRIRHGAAPSRDITVTAFRATDATGLLGQGPIVIAAPDAGADADGATTPMALPIYEAAVIDRLAGAGYQTAVPSGSTGQVAEVTVSKAVVIPEEAPRKPVSGEVGVSVGNRGTATSMAIAVDLTKPKKAVIGTRLDVRIRDKASGRVLWEGHAEGQARDSADGFDDGSMAERLATALFARFPDGQEVGDPAGS